MSVPELSVNVEALKLVKELCADKDKFGVTVKEAKSGATIIDAGIEATGGFLAGRIVTEICLGGLGRATLFHAKYGDIELQSISVFTDNPAIATLGSQFAGWKIKVGRYSAIGSGPARALSLKPKSIFETIGYRDRSDNAVLVLETSKEPAEDVTEHISSLCSVKPKSLFLVLVPTSSVAGFTQISGRIVETGMHKLANLGFDPKLIRYAHGYAPIMPVHPNYAEAMGRVNDAIIYGGVACCYVEFEGSDETLRGLAEKAVSSVSEQYGRPFIEIFKEAGLDFYKIDPDLFAPAVIMISNIKTGRTFKAGGLDTSMLKKSVEN